MSFGDINHKNGDTSKAFKSGDTSKAATRGNFAYRVPYLHNPIKK
jgi:hypothetical protein